MGWWDMGKKGKVDLCMGDEPADIMGVAVDKLIALYQKMWDRRPTKTEIRAALEFVLGPYTERMKERK